MSKLSQQIVATVLAHAGVQSNAEVRHDAAVNVDANMQTVRNALVSSQSILSLLYHRERSSLTEQSQQDVYEALCDVERAVKAARSEDDDG